MKLVVGLGNPGSDYEGTRHNVGAAAVARALEKKGERFSEKRFAGQFSELKHAGKKVAFLFPHTYMNRSGESVLGAKRALGLENADILVLSDDVDLAFGRLRLKPSGSDGGQRGLRSIIDSLGADNFPRLKIGIGRPPRHIDTAEYVLAPFGPDERPALPDVLDRAADCVWMWVARGLQSAMNAYNKAPASAPPSTD